MFSKRTRLRKSVYDRVAGRWSDLGLPGTAPNILSFEGEQGETPAGTLYHNEKAMRSAYEMPAPAANAGKKTPAKKKK